MTIKNMRATERRRLGQTDVELTELGFGCASIGGMYGPVDIAAAHTTLERAFALGLTYFDTSPWYGRGLSEHVLGDVLRDKPRSTFVLSTKVGRVLRAAADSAGFDRTPWQGGFPFAHAHDYSYDGIMRSYEDSLQRLGLASIDLLLIHDLDDWHFHEVSEFNFHMAQLAKSGYRALDALKASGAIKAIGVGINHHGLMSRFFEVKDLDFFLVALCYTLLDQSALPEMQIAERQGKGFVIGGVFNSGILATGPTHGATFNYAPASAEVRSRLSKIGDIAKRHDIPVGAAALQFPLGVRGVASVIPGGYAPGHVEQNFDMMNLSIPEAFWTDLISEGLIDDASPTP
jgi:D-threo-aldose 1-dehydrogenase